MWINALFFGLMLFASAACEGEPADSAESLTESYETQGEVRRIEADARSITIAHEDVPGYMPAMTMPFAVEDLALLEGIEVGDQVRFTFEPRSGGQHVLMSIDKLPAG